MHGDTVKLYLWKDSFYEVWSCYAEDKINSVEKVVDENKIDLYIQAMNRTGTPPISKWDAFENLREVGKIIQPILERDHPEFLKKLYWDEKLRWFCEVIEVQAAYLLDEILPKNKGMLVTQARDIAIKQLLKAPQKHMKPPYIKIDEDYSDGIIDFPWWFMGRYSQQGCLIEDEYPYGDGISQVLSQLDGFGGWEDATSEEYWEEQRRLGDELVKKYNQKGKL